MAALMAALLAAALAPQAPAFEASVEAVYLDVFVSDRGKPVKGLDEAAFEILDNGVRQAATLVSVEDVPTCAVLVFDTSGSVSGRKLDHLRAAAHAFLRGLRPGDQAALVTFSQRLRLRVPATREIGSVQHALDAIEPEGSTALFDAVYTGTQVAAGPGRAMVVLFSDGGNRLSWLSEADALGVIEASDVLVHAVGLTPPKPPAAPLVRGSRLEDKESPALRSLRLLAEASGGRLWLAEASADLEATFLGILEESRTRYLLRYVPTGLPREGRHKLEVRLKGHKGVLRARRGYYVAPE